MARPDFETSYLRGIELFNEGAFWHAHEAWEELWLVAESDVHQYLQGLIQLAAAYHHVQKGTISGAARLFDAALVRLSAFPDPFCGTERAAAEALARIHRALVIAALESGERMALGDGEFPRLIQLEGKAVTPPLAAW